MTEQSYKGFAYYYDELMVDMPYPQWVQFAMDCWKQQLNKPRKVIDLGCGTGTITLLLADSGLEMIGIDLSADMLAVANAKEYDRFQPVGSKPIRWLQQDMCELALGSEQVDSVVSFCDCINYLTEEQQVAAVFANVYQVLRAGGSFLFDVHHPALLRRYGDEQPFFSDAPHLAYIWTCDYDELRNEVEHQLSIFAEQEDGRFQRVDEIHRQRAYEPVYLKGLLQQAGFVDIQIYADFKRQAADSDAERIFFVANK